MQLQTVHGRKRRKALFLLVLGLFLLVIGVASLFALQGKSIQFDRNFDNGGDLSGYIFGQTAEDGSRLFAFQKACCLTLLRHRAVFMLAGVVRDRGFVAEPGAPLYPEAGALCLRGAFHLHLPGFLPLSADQHDHDELPGDHRHLHGMDRVQELREHVRQQELLDRGEELPAVHGDHLRAADPGAHAAGLYRSRASSASAGKFFKTVAFMPVLSSVVVAGIIFRMMFSELPGALMNQVVTSLGGEPVIWLKGEWTAMFAMVLLCCWRWTGMNILYYMAGLKSIPGDLYEAAEIDGAGAVQKFLHVGWPLLKPTTIYVLTISIYAGLSMFTESYMIFGGNNSPKNYGLTIVGYLYRYGFEKVDKFGFASAVGLVLLVGAMIITVAQLLITGTIGPKSKEVRR